MKTATSRYYETGLMKRKTSKPIVGTNPSPIDVHYSFLYQQFRHLLLPPSPRYLKYFVKWKWGRRKGGTHYINVSTLTYMHQCNNKIHTDGNLNENINERFGILGGPLQPVLCRLAGHLVKTKILSEPHIL